MLPSSSNAKKVRLVCAMVVTFVVSLPLAGIGIASAGAVITTGSVSIGVFDEGHLGSGGVGISIAGVGDAIIPGCLCEGWGVSADGIAGYANVASDGGANNLVVDSFVSGTSSATSTVHLGSLPTLTVTQAYGPSGGAPLNLFEDLVTITNTGPAITDLRYRRVMDWDVPPTPFNEFVTIGGLPAANLIFSGDQGFASANPLSPAPAIVCTDNTNVTDCGPADHGSVFDLQFGPLGTGESRSFSVFYGGAFSETAAFAALGAVGAEIFSLGQSNGGQITGAPGTYIWGFKGVGGTPVGPTPPPGAVPEPGTFLLLGTGGALLYRRLRKTKPQEKV
jgi:type IV pilus assembly protein PilY1